MARDLQCLVDFKDEGRREDVLTEHIEMSRTMRHGLRCVGMKGCRMLDRDVGDESVAPVPAAQARGLKLGTQDTRRVQMLQWVYNLGIGGRFRQVHSQSSRNWETQFQKIG